MTQTEMDNLQKLISPRYGLFSRVTWMKSSLSDLEFEICISSLNAQNSSPGYVRDIGGSGPPCIEKEYLGVGISQTESGWRAITEGLARYSSSVFDEDQLIWGTANELGDEAIDFNLLPRCSEEELAHPFCPLQAPDPAAPIRWVRGVSLLSGKLVWLPAIMVYLDIPYRSVGERFWLPGTIGCAAHETVEEALIDGICDVIERDAASIVWLQKLALPRININEVRDERLSICLERLEHATGTEQYFFDATTVSGIPTIFSMQTSAHSKQIKNVIACGAAPIAEMAITKTITQAINNRLLLQTSREIPSNWDHFHHSYDGAMEMGRAEHQHAFEFLLKSHTWRRLSEMDGLAAARPRDTLRMVIDSLSMQGLEAYAVDLTTDEALRVGMRVVRVIIPGLQPGSYSYRARFLSHTRLYQAPATLGYRVFQEPQLNHWPQPLV